jgi:hypothetical protein
MEFTKSQEGKKQRGVWWGPGGNWKASPFNAEGFPIQAYEVYLYFFAFVNGF